MRTEVDPAYILQILDREHQGVADSGTHLEVTSNVVRAVGPAWNGIAFSRFSTAEAETIIDQEIAYWSSFNRAFEWKLYSHDQPPDLIIRLRKRGFKIGPEEALMVLDVEQVSETLPVTPSKAIKVEKISDVSRHLLFFRRPVRRSLSEGGCRRCQRFAPANNRNASIASYSASPS